MQYIVYVLYLGNITNVMIHYNKEHQSVICVSQGGPVTTVTWSLNNVRISANGQTEYENSQTIINTTGAVYENSLKIINKRSAMAGVYRCTISNPLGNLYAELDIQGKVHDMKS